MGLLISRVWDSFFGLGEVRMLMIGLDAAGKTTILYKLKLGEVVKTVPTIGFNVESVNYKNISFNVWDIGGQDKIRALWRHYYEGTQGIIFVVDSNDQNRLPAAKKEILNVLQEPELKGACLLVFANKQDLPKAVSTAQMIEALGLRDIKDRPWHVQGATATTGEGLFEGLEWVSQSVAKTQKK